MMRGLDAAHGELIAFSDSDTRPSPHLLNGLVDELEAHSDTADAFAPALVAEPCELRVTHAKPALGTRSPERAARCNRGADSILRICGCGTALAFRYASYENGGRVHSGRGVRAVPAVVGGRGAAARDRAIKERP
jgi:hypothetical protein